MKKMVSVLVVLGLMATMFAMAESGDMEWYELTENVLTVRVPVDAEGETWEYVITDPEMLEMVTQEYDGNMYVASFANFAPREDKVTLALMRKNADGTMNQVNRVRLAMDAEGTLAVEAVEAGSPDEDFGLFFNPVGYGLMQVTGIEIPDGETLCVEGSFGDIKEDEEAGLRMLGFDEEKKATIALAEEYTVLVPATLDDPDVNVEVEDIAAWYEDACQLLEAEYRFYANVEMNENGEVTRLEYVYIP